MVRSKHLFAGMAERCMAEVMEQSSGVKHTLLSVQGRIEINQPAHRPSGDGKHTEGVGEPTRLGAVKREECRPQLADAPKSLERGRIHEREHHGFGWLIRIQPDAVMERVVIGA